MVLPAGIDELVDLGTTDLVIRRPADAESLIDEERFEEDEFLPYWAEVWPSGLALARHVATVDLRGKCVLELGCGLALPTLAAAVAGARVLATDWAPECIELVAFNAAANGLTVDAEVVDWTTANGVARNGYDLVIAADVLYEERNAAPLVALLDEAVALDGEVLIADPGRRHATAFFERARAAGWAVERTPVDALRAGGLFRLRRSTE